MTSVEEAVSDHSSSMEVPKVKLSTVPVDHEEQTSRDCSNDATTSGEISPISGDLDVANLEILKRNPDDTEESLKKICEVKDSVAVNGTEAKDNEIVQDHQDIREGEILVTKSDVIDTSKAQEGVILRDSEVVDSVEEVDVQGQEHIESVEVKSKEENLSSDVQSGEPEEFQDAEPETFLIDKRGSKHVFEETSSSAEDKDCVDKEELKDDSTKVDQIDQIEQLQKPSIEVSSEESEEISTKVDEKPEEEVRLQQETPEETKSVAEVAEEAQEETKSVTEVAEEVQEETKSVQEVAEEGQEEKETELQKVEIEKHDSRTEEVSNGQQSLLEEIEVEDKIKKSLEIVETAESQSSLAEDQEHETVSEKTEDVKVKDTETTDDLSVPHEASRLEDNDTLKAEEKEGDEELSETEALESLSSSKTAENVDIEEEESRNLGAVKLEELKEDKGEEILETTKVIEAKNDRSLAIETSQADQTQSSEVESGLEEQTPKPVHEIQEEEAKKADDLELTVDQSLPVETSETELESRQDDKTSNLVEEIHEKETKEVQKLEATADQSLPVEASQVDQTPFSEIVSGLDDQNPKQVEEIQEEETMEANKVETKADQSLQVETSHVDQTLSSELVSELDDQTPKLVKEIHEEETKEADKLDTLGEESLPVNTLLADQTPSSELVSGLDDQTPKQVGDIHEEETKEAHKLVVADDQSLLVEKPHEHQTPSSELVPELDDETAKQVEEIHEEKTEEEHKLEVVSDRSLPVAALQAEHTSSSELVSRLQDDTPKQVEEIHEEDTKEPHKLEATRDESFAVETSHEDQTSPSEIVSKLDDQTKQVEDYQVEEKHGALKLEATIDQSGPVETSDQTPPSELVSKLDEEIPKQIEEIHEEEAKKAYELEVTSDQSLPVETSQENQTPSSELVSESKQTEEIQEEDTKEAHKLVAVGDQSLPVEVSQVEQTPSSELVSGLDDNTPKKVEEIHEQEPQESHKLEAMADQSLPVETSQVDQILSSELVSEVNDQKPKHGEEIQKEESEEAHKLEVVGDQRLPVEASQVDQTLSSELVSELNDQTPKQEDNHQEETKEALADQSLPVDISHGDQTPLSDLVSRLDDQTPKQVEEIHEEETKQAPKLQAEEIPLTEAIPRESFNEAPVSMLASREDEQVTRQEDNGASEVKETKDRQEEQLVSAETVENVGETKPKESKAEEAEKSADQAETSSYPLSLEKETHDNPDYPTLSKEIGEAEHEDDTDSTLPVVGILKELQTTLETERAIEDSASSGEKMRLEPAEEVEKVEANEKYFEPSFEAEPETPVTDIRESITNENQATTFAEETPAAEEVGVSVEEKLQEEEVREIKENPVDQSLTDVLPCEKILLATSAVLSEEPEHVFSTEKQEHTAEEDAYASTVEKTNLQEEHARDFDTSLKVDDVSDEIIEAKVPADQPRTLQKPESHETVEKDQISHFKEDKEQESHSLLGNEVEIDAVITPEKQITEPSESLKKASEAEHESNEEHVEPQAISDDTKTQDDRDSIPIEQAPKDQVEEEKTKKLEGHDIEDNADELLTKEALDEQLQVPSSAFSSKEKEQVAEAVENSNTEAMTDTADQELVVQKPLELIQSQSPNLPLQEKLEETSFEVKKVQEDKDEEIVDAPMIKENIHVQDQPKEFEAPSKNEDTNVKLEVHDDKLGGENLEEHSVVALKEETGLIEEKREIENMKTESEDAMKHGIDQQISVPLIATTDKALGLKEEKEEPENIQLTEGTHKDEPENIQLTEATHKDELNKAPEQSQDLVSLEGKEIVKNEVSEEEKSDTYEKIDQSPISEATKEIYQEESKQTDTFIAAKEETREEKNLSEGSEEIPAEKKTQDTMVLQKEIPQECFNSMKNVYDATEETKPEVQKPESLSSLNTTQDKSKETEKLHGERSPSQQPREIAHEVKQENLKNAGDGESEEADNTKDLFSEVKESESPPKEPARKSLSDLHKVRGVKETSKVEDTTASHIEEESKTEEEEDGEEHKEDKTSPDSIVMVEAKDTANMIKTPHKKSHGILSGVGSKVKHSISKVKKAITGKSSHTKPSSPQ